MPTPSAAPETFTDHPDDKSAVRNTPTASPRPAPTETVRLSVNLAPGVAQTLKQLAEARGSTVTDEIRRAIALDQLVTEAVRKGHRVTVVEGHGDQAQFRDLVFL